MEGNNETRNVEHTFPTTLQASIDSVIQKEGYISYNIYKRNIATEGANYLGQLYEVDIKGKTADGDKETNIFVKRALPGDFLESFFSIADAYSNEAYFYKELSSIYTEIQDEAKIPSAERYKVLRNFEESNSETIILENMAKKGFKTGYRMDVMSSKFAELSVLQLAKFHGLSFALKKLRPAYFEQKISRIVTPFDYNDSWKAIAINFLNNTISNVDSENKKTVEDLVPIFLEKFPKYFTVDKSVINCLCHGDYRQNNILMKEIDGEVTEVIPIDYQMIRYCCPADDLIFLIFLGTDRQFRREHLNNLKNLYYNSLGKFLHYFQIDVEEVYPRNDFEHAFRERMDYGLLVALYFFPLNFAAKQDAPDFGKDSLENIHLKLDHRFRNRVKGLLDDFTEWGCIV